MRANPSLHRLRTRSGDERKKCLESGDERNKYVDLREATVPSATGFG